MLYKEFTNINNTIGSDIDNINGNMGFSFINFSSILFPPKILYKNFVIKYKLYNKKATQLPYNNYVAKR